jgi:hypothetical protein
MSTETVIVRVTNIARGLELARFMVPPNTQANIIIEQGPSQVVLYVPGVDVPMCFIGCVRVTIERHG